MLKELELKKQIIIVIEFLVAYFSPLIGILLFMALRYKKQVKLYQWSPLLGAALALIIYIVDYIIYSILI